MAAKPTRADVFRDLQSNPRYLGMLSNRDALEEVIKHSRRLGSKDLRKLESMHGDQCKRIVAFENAAIKKAGAKL